MIFISFSSCVLLSVLRFLVQNSVHKRYSALPNEWKCEWHLACDRSAGNWTECFSAYLEDYGSVLLMRGLSVSVAMEAPLVGWGGGVSDGETPARHLSWPYFLPCSMCTGQAIWRGGEAGGYQLKHLPWIPALSLTSCVISDKFLNLSEFQFIYLKNGDGYECLALNKYYGTITHSVDVTDLGAPTLGFGLNTQQDS